MNLVNIDSIKHVNIVTEDEQQHAKITYQEYMKESEILIRQGISLQKYWLNIIDEIISRESHSEDGQVSDPFHDINLVCHDYQSQSDTTVVIHDRHSCQSIPHIIDLGCHIYDAPVTDKNIAGKNRGFLATTVKQFEFIGPDRSPQKLDSISDYITAAKTIRSTGVLNYKQAWIPVISTLNIAAWEDCLAVAIY